MLSKIRICNGEPWPLDDFAGRLNEISDATDWYSPTRLAPQGPYQSIILNIPRPLLTPKEGPLEGTATQWHRFWCAVSEGKLILADKKSDRPPELWDEKTVVRGYYDVDFEESMQWYPIGDPWDNDEIYDRLALSNISYRLYEKVPETPLNVFLFGAGASYGSDSKYVREKGLLPPLGNDLFPMLRDAPNLELWRKVPYSIQKLFETSTFEKAMEALDAFQLGFGLGRDIELALFFAKYSLKPSNLYRKLGFHMARAISGKEWSGALVTLNYERLLEEGMLSSRLFTVVKGVTHYDLPPSDLTAKNLVEVCYPHGACQFIIPHGNRFKMKIREQLEIETLDSLVGVQHILSQTNVVGALNQDHFPMICRYQPNKRPSMNNYFISGQRQRVAELINGAERITIVGVQCSAETDVHLWGPLACTKAVITYVEPNKSGIEKFRAWATSIGKTENIEYSIIPKPFDEAFGSILQVNNL